MPDTNDSRNLDLPFPELSDDADVPLYVQLLAARLVAIGPVLYSQTTAALRPTSTGGSPGVQGRFHYATDTGALSYDYGTGWISLGGLTSAQVEDIAVAMAAAL